MIRVIHLIINTSSKPNVTEPKGFKSFTEIKRSWKLIFPLNCQIIEFTGSDYKHYILKNGEVNNNDLSKLRFDITSSIWCQSEFSS